MGYILKGIKVTESQISDVIFLCLQSDESINVAMVSIHGITSKDELSSGFPARSVYSTLPVLVPFANERSTTMLHWSPPLGVCINCTHTSTVPFPSQNEYSCSSSATVAATVMQGYW